QNRRIRGIDLGVDRRRRQIRWQQVAGCVDRRLYLLLGDVERNGEIELEGDDGCAGGADGIHLVQIRNLAELDLQRRRNRGGHHVRACSRIERLNLKGRIVDLGKGGDRQETKRKNARQHDRNHQERSRHRTHDERMRRVHGFYCFSLRRSLPSGGPAAGGDCGFSERNVILAPSRRRSAPSLTTRSPGLTPSRASTRSPSVTPRAILRTMTVLSALMR